jgi:sigma-B regulation protein RsbQ
MDIARRNNVRRTGRGQPMLFAHGFGCDQAMWRHVAPAFEKEHEVVLFDYVGLGKSDLRAWDRTRYSSLNGFAEDVLDIVRALDLREIVFVGHSVSSVVGMLAAIEEPTRFSRLVLVGPSPRYLNDEGYVGGFERKQIEEMLDTLDSNYVGWSSAMAPAIVGNPERPELGRELTESFCRVSPEVASTFARATFLSDNRADLPRVQTPCAVLQCSQDVIAPEVVGRYVHEHLPQSRFFQLAATGHCPNLSAPTEVISTMRTFLRES